MRRIEQAASSRRTPRSAKVAAALALTASIISGCSSERGNDQPSETPDRTSQFIANIIANYPKLTANALGENCHNTTPTVLPTLPDRVATASVCYTDEGKPYVAIALADRYTFDPKKYPEASALDGINVAETPSNQYTTPDGTLDTKAVGKKRDLGDLDVAYQVLQGIELSPVS